MPSGWNSVHDWKQVEPRLELSCKCSSNRLQESVAKNSNTKLGLLVYWGTSLRNSKYSIAIIVTPIISPLNELHTLSLYKPLLESWGPVSPTVGSKVGTLSWKPPSPQSMNEYKKVGPSSCAPLIKDNFKTYHFVLSCREGVLFQRCFSIECISILECTRVFSACPL